MTGAGFYTVRAVLERGRLRLRSDGDKPLYVQTMRGWRADCQRGAVLTIRARMRSDGECLVMMPLL